MIAGLKSLGIEINQIQSSDPSVPDLLIKPGQMFGPAGIDVGNAGTVMRFLPPVSAFAKGLINFDGDPRSHERPVGPVIKAMEDLGILVNHNNQYRLPITINASGKVLGGKVEIDATNSSQFVSALMLIGARCENGLEIINIATTTPSLPHIDMTINCLADYGIKVESGEGSWKISQQEFKGIEKTIEPDLSNAAPFLAAAIITNGIITIRHWPKNTSQAGDKLREIFSQMGAEIELTDSGLTVTGTGKIKGIEIDLHEVGELTPSIAALASLASTPSHLKNIGHLRLHETDRLSALATEINALGGEVIEEKDNLIINPKPLRSGIFHTYDDHRMATAGAMLGLTIKDIQVENIETTKKTLPDFVGLWQSILN